MGKSLSIILMGCLFMGCVTTNDYTAADFAQGKKPMAPGLGILSGFIPGLPQLINGEYIEAGAIFGTFMLSSAVLQGTGSAEGEIIPGKEIPYYAALGVAVTAWGYGVTDGYSSSRDRVDQYKAIFDSSSLYTEQEKQAIKDKQIFVGMGQAALIESWGRPSDINESAGAWGIRHQYVYPGLRFVYIEKGKVTGWN